jgi:hypothetical protein
MSPVPDSSPPVVRPSPTPVTWNPRPVAIISTIVTGTIIIRITVRIGVIRRGRRCNYRRTDNHRRYRYPNAKRDPC